MQASREKSASPSSIVTAIAFALIVVSLSGSQPAAALTLGDRTVAGLETERDLLAAAVAATRDLLGLDRSVVAGDVLATRWTPGNLPGEVTITAAGTDVLWIRRPPARLTNIPPPTC